MVNFLIFVFATIGLTNIFVESVIMQPLREWVGKRSNQWFLGKISQILDCYQCCGFWCGLIIGLIMFSIFPGSFFYYLLRNIIVGLICGFAGSFLATFTALLINYLEAKSVIDE
jgi:uncharacterized membrane protein YeaQ/YmgE (transglycosylase-associated protein family)